MSLKAVIGLATMTLFGLTILSLWFVSPQEDFRPENHNWNGLTDLQGKYQVEPLEQGLPLSQLTGNSLIISIPYLEPTTEEVAELRSYVEEGGVLIIADDHRFGNKILRGLEVDARFHGDSLVDPLFNYGYKEFLLINDIRPSPLTTNVSSLKLNYATVLEIENGIVAANSSSFSFIDSNLDSVRQEEERIGPFPVIAHFGIGDGKLILISDPSIFINGMIEQNNNPEFLFNLFRTAGPDATVYLQMDHLPKSLLIEGKELLVRIRSWTSGPTQIMAITLIIIAVLLYPIWKKGGGSLV